MGGHGRLYQFLRTATATEPVEWSLFQVVTTSVCRAVQPDLRCVVPFWHWRRNVERQAFYGQSALVAGPFVGVFLATMLTVVVWAGCSFGLWLFSRYRPIVLELQVFDGMSSTSSDAAN